MNCNYCEGTYIGMTKNYPPTRLCNHAYNFKNHNENASVLKNQSLHNFERINLGSPSILVGEIEW